MSKTTQTDAFAAMVYACDLAITDLQTICNLSDDSCVLSVAKHAALHLGAAISKARHEREAELAAAQAAKARLDREAKLAASGSIRCSADAR
jgi:hypothetical protein